MNIEIMQPYLFPYIGYFQLIHATDCFVIYDSVQFIKRGWINRNNILVQGNAHLITFPVKKNDYLLNINEREYIEDLSEQKKLLRTIFLSYQKAPYFEEVYSLIEEILNFKNRNVVKFNENSLKLICDYLEINTIWRLASEFDIPSELDAQDKIIFLCKQLGAKQYTNAIGGVKLYSPEVFAENKIHLKFLKTKLDLNYRQFQNQFIPNLSIIDVMMFNSKFDIYNLLNAYDIIDSEVSLEKNY